MSIHPESSEGPEDAAALGWRQPLPKHSERMQPAEYWTILGLALAAIIVTTLLASLAE